MLDSSTLFKYQIKYGVGKTSDIKDEVSYEYFLNECRRSVNAHTPREFYSWDMERQARFTENQIVQFVTSSDKAVSGYIKDGARDNVALINAVKIAILDMGIIGEALEDDEVQEIQINDCKTIWVVKNGKTEIYRDRSGNPQQFLNDEEVITTLTRLCYVKDKDTKRMTKADPLMNTRTARRGFRVSGLYWSSVTPDKPPYDFSASNITIRKQNSTVITFEDMIRGRTLAPRMVDFLKKMARANTKMFFVGPTSSGKTTLMRSELLEINKNMRMILIQNPTEILMYDRDINGTNRRNVLHWEAEDIPEEEVTSTKNTMANLVSHSLRNSPDVVVTGEARTPQEFYQINRVSLTGQRVIGTFHAEDGEGAIERFATEVATAAKGQKNEYLESAANNIDCIVCQYKLDDGNRRVMAIDLPTGEIKNGRPEIIRLFEFKMDRESSIDENGNVKEIKGKFYQTGCIDKDGKLAEKMYKAGFSYSDIAVYCESSHIGEMIDEYLETGDDAQVAKGNKELELEESKEDAVLQGLLNFTN